MRASAKCYKHGLRHLLQGICPANVAKGRTQRPPKYACSVIPTKVVLAYTSDISKDGQRIEKERREFSSSANFGALGAGRNGVNLGRDEFSGQNGVNSRNGDLVSKTAFRNAQTMRVAFVGRSL